MSSPFVVSGDELRLSNPGQLELLRGMAERGAPLRTTARGSSMAPFIRDRDVLTIAPLNGREPRVGDVVAFELPAGRLAVHRVVARTGAGWLIRGDAVSGADGVVATTQLLGRVVRVERDGRDVGLGLGAERVWVAGLNRMGALAALAGLYRRLRHGGAQVFRRAQGVPAYRWLGSRIAPSFVIARASATDLAAVHHRVNPFGPEAPQAPDPDATDWVAKRGDNVVGYVQYVHHATALGPWSGDWLSSLVVWGPYRGLGVGTALTRRVVEQAEARGAAELLLAVSEDNRRAIELYRKLGFERSNLPELEPVFADELRRIGSRRVVMSRPLAAEVTRP